MTNPTPKHAVERFLAQLPMLWATFDVPIFPRMEYRKQVYAFKEILQTSYAAKTKMNLIARHLLFFPRFRTYTIIGHRKLSKLKREFARGVVVRLDDNPQADIPIRCICENDKGHPATPEDGGSWGVRPLGITNEELK